MNRSLALAAGALLLAGCSSVGSLRDSTPTAIYVGTASVEDVAGCVSQAWSTKPIQVKTVDLFGGTSIQLQKDSGGPVLAVADIKAVGPKTVAKYFSRFPDDDTWYFQQIKDCMLTNGDVD
jgi:uncharacterized protein YceK